MSVVANEKRRVRGEKIDVEVFCHAIQEVVWCHQSINVMNPVDEEFIECQHS